MNTYDTTNDTTEQTTEKTTKNTSDNTTDNTKDNTQDKNNDESCIKQEVGLVTDALSIATQGGEVLAVLPEEVVAHHIKQGQGVFHDLVSGQRTGNILLLINLVSKFVC